MSDIISLFVLIDEEVKVSSYEPHAEDLAQHVQPGTSIEVRGLVKSPAEL